MAELFLQPFGQGVPTLSGDVFDQCIRRMPAERIAATWASGELRRASVHPKTAASQPAALTRPMPLVPNIKARRRRMTVNPMTDQAPTVILNTVGAATAGAAIVPGLITNEGDAAGWRYVEFFSANINNPTRPRLRQVLHLVRAASHDARRDPPVRCGGVGERIAGTERAG